VYFDFLTLYPDEDFHVLHPLKILDGEDTLFQSEEFLTGNVRERYLNNTEGKMFLRYTTDIKIASRGFTVEAICSDPPPDVEPVAADYCAGTACGLVAGHDCANHETGYGCSCWWTEEVPDPDPFDPFDLAWTEESTLPFDSSKCGPQSMGAFITAVGVHGSQHARQEFFLGVSGTHRSAATEPLVVTNHLLIKKLESVQEVDFRAIR